MWNKSAGMTLIELTLAIVIISIGLVGVLAAYQQAVRGSADPVVNKQMLALAEEMMEEILLRPYSDPVSTPASGCARTQFKKIDDYHEYHSTPPCDIEGTPLDMLNGFSISITVTNENLGSPPTPSKKITVEIKRGNQTLSLVGYRTDWAS